MRICLCDSLTTRSASPCYGVHIHARTHPDGAARTRRPGTRAGARVVLAETARIAHDVLRVPGHRFDELLDRVMFDASRFLVAPDHEEE